MPTTSLPPLDAAPRKRRRALRGPLRGLLGPAGSRLRSLYDRFQHLVHELGKFGVVGGTAFVIDTVLFGALLGAGMETVLAKTVATVVSATAAFLGNRFWTWRHRARSALHREYLLYFVFNLIGLGITLAVLWLSHYVLGGIWPVFATPAADLVVGQLIGNALATVFRFWTYRRFVFKPGNARASRQEFGQPEPQID